MGKLGSAKEDEKKPFKTFILNKLALRLKDESHKVQIAAHVAIITVHQQLSKDHLAPILKFIEDPNPMVRLDAIAAMASAGPDCKKYCPNVIDTLLATAKDPVPDVGVNALMAVVHLHGVESHEDIERPQGRQVGEPSHS